MYNNYFQIQNIYCLPCIYPSLEFAQYVKNTFFALNPDCIAIQLPSSILAKLKHAVQRLPYLSLLAYNTPNSNTKKHLVIEPANPFIEATRLALEYEIELYLVDNEDNEYKDNFNSIWHDIDYYLFKCGLKDFYSTYKKRINTKSQNKDDLKSILTMVYQIKNMALSYNKILFLYDINYHEMINTLLSDKDILNPNYNTHDTKLECHDNDINIFHLPSSKYNDILLNMPFLIYTYELMRKGLNRFHTELNPQRPLLHTHVDEKNIQKFILQTEDIAEWLAPIKSKESHLDRYDFLHDLIIYTKNTYQKYWGSLREGAGAITLKLARNYALIENNLVPNAQQLLYAAKNVVNKTFAYELYRIMSFYPFQDNYDMLTEFKKESIYKNKEEKKQEKKQENQKKEENQKKNNNNDNNNDNLIQISKSQKTWINKKNISFITKDQKQERVSGLWHSLWEKGSIISYDKEDIRLENYCNYLRGLGNDILKSKTNNKEVKLTTSFLDGLNPRETIKELARGKIIVCEKNTLKKFVGNVVIIFDSGKDAKKDIYPTTMSWFAEGVRSSDILLYSTTPGEKLVGPGISLAEYGGLLSVYPPKGKKDSWSKNQFDKKIIKSKHLLLSALTLSTGTHIVCLSKEIPSKYIYNFASKHKKAIIHIPISKVSPYLLTKIKFFHCLSDKKLHSIANKYIKL